MVYLLGISYIVIKYCQKNIIKYSKIIHMVQNTLKYNICTDYITSLNQHNENYTINH